MIPIYFLICDRLTHTTHKINDYEHILHKHTLSHTLIILHSIHNTTHIRTHYSSHKQTDTTKEYYGDIVVYINIVYSKNGSINTLTCNRMKYTGTYKSYFEKNIMITMT